MEIPLSSNHRQALRGPHRDGARCGYAGEVRHRPRLRSGEVAHTDRTSLTEDWSVETRQGADFFSSEECATSWNRVFADARHAPVEMSHAWSLSWIEPSGSSSPTVLIARRDGSPVALFPIAVRRAAGVRVARPLSSHPCSTGLLVRGDAPRAAMHIALALPDVVDCLLMHDVSSQDGNTLRFLDTLRSHGWTVSQRKRNVVRTISLEGTLERLLSRTKSAKSRQTIRRKARKLTKSHEVRIERYRPQEVNQHVLIRCSHIHAESWLERRGGAHLCESFYQRLIQGCAQANLVEVWIMAIDGEDAAFVVSGVTHGRHQYLWPGFKMKFASSHSVGQVLLMSVIEDACNDGCREFDFGHGDGDYKKFWGTDQYEVFRFFAGHGFRGRLAARLVDQAWSIADIGTVKRTFRKVRSFVRRARRRR